MHPSHLTPPESSEKFLGRTHKEHCSGVDEDGQPCVVCKFYDEVIVIQEVGPMDYMPLQPAHEPDYDRLDTNPVSSPDDDEEAEEGYDCPWCGKDHQTTDHIRQCSGWKPSGMPPNETGHEYGCGCSDCMVEYQGLK